MYIWFVLGIFPVLGIKTIEPSFVIEATDTIVEVSYVVKTHLLFGRYSSGTVAKVYCVPCAYTASSLGAMYPLKTHNLNFE